MKQMKRYWFLGVLLVAALLFAGMTFAKSVTRNPGEGESAIEATAVQPESLCDFEYLWGGGITVTADSNGTAMVWGGGINFYFAGATDPTHPIEVLAYDIPLRVRIHNNRAYFFCMDGTYVYDITTITSPALLYEAPGWSGSYTDAVPTMDDKYLLMTAVDTTTNPGSYSSTLNVWDLELGAVVYTKAPPNVAPRAYTDCGYYSVFIPEDTHGMGKVAIVGDWSEGWIDFWDISNLACKAPVWIGGIDDKIQSHDLVTPHPASMPALTLTANSGLVYYKYPYLYSSAIPWQQYNPHLDNIAPYGDTNATGCWVGLYRIEDVLTPSNHYYVKEHKDKYDIVTLKDSGDYIFMANAQRRIALYEPQFANIVDDGYVTRDYDTKANLEIYDAGWASGSGVAAYGSGGARFFDTSLLETGHYITGGTTSDVIVSGNYLLVPSGGAGLAIIDNTDVTKPRTLAFLEPGAMGLEAVHFVAVSSDGNTCFVADNTKDKVWVVDISLKTAPAIVGIYDTDGSSTTVGPFVTGLGWANGYLVVGTAATVDLVDYSIPAAPAMVDRWDVADVPPLDGAVTTMEIFHHPAYPDQDFIGLVTPTSFWTFRVTSGVFEYTGHVGTGLMANTDFAVVKDMAYVAGVDGGLSSNIVPVSLVANSPLIHFTLTAYAAVVVKAIPSPIPAPTYGVYVEKASDTMVVITAGYPTDPTLMAFYLMDVGTDPTVPALLPAGQAGLTSFSGDVTGLRYSGGYVYYGDGSVGTGCLTLVEDYDLPVFQPQPVPVFTVTPVYGPTCGPPRVLQGVVTLSVQVMDATTAITGVKFTYNGFTIATLAGTSAAGVVGTYTYQWDTTTWAGPVTGAAIVAEATDSGCNTATLATADTYTLNKIPEFGISWAEDCNYPPAGGPCAPAEDWIVCGNLQFAITGYEPATNAKMNCAASAISQIAINFDNGPTGPWDLYDISTDANNPLVFGVFTGAEPITGVATPYGGLPKDLPAFDTTGLTDGEHTLYVRVTDNVTLRTQTDINGVSSWTFTVHNLGPEPYITSPMAGDIVRGEAIHVAAQVNSELAARPVNLVKFYLDPTDANNPLTGTLIGTATTKDENGEFSFTWDATLVPYGDHILIALVWEDSVCCAGPFKTPLVSFNLVSYTGMTVSASAAPTSGDAPLSTVLTASVSGGTAPYTYAWDFGDGQTGAGNVVSHTYTTAGNYTATVTVTDNTATTATATVSLVVSAPPPPPCTPAVITGIQKLNYPTVPNFRLRVSGAGFQPGCHVQINGVTVPLTTYKNSGLVVAKKGGVLKAMCPKGVTVQVTVVNPDGCVSANFPYTR